MASNFYWLISAPQSKTQDTFDAVNRRTAHAHATNHKFEVPDLKVGTLDSLMMLSDDLARIDAFVENTTKKIVRQLTDVDKKPEKNESLTVGGTAIDFYITHFNWDEARYPVRSPLKELTDKIHGQVGKLDEELKVKAADYIVISNTISAEERKLGGNLLVKSLAEHVDANTITDTEYLTTLLVVVPKYLYKDWQANYETLTNYVLPRSSKLLTEDTEYGLFAVTLFKRVVEDFKNIARERRFTVRDFKMDEDGKSGKEERSKLITEKDRQRRHLIRWCKTNFAEAFIAWIHLKAIRVFVESVLRYGLPVNFQAILMQPHKKEDKKLREALSEMFKHLASVHVLSAKEDETEKFYPYVYIPIDFTEM